MDDGRAQIRSAGRTSDDDGGVANLISVLAFKRPGFLERTAMAYRRSDDPVIERRRRAVWALTLLTIVAFAAMTLVDDAARR